MKFVTAYNTFNPAEAQLIRSLLESAGFQASVRNELSSLSIDGYSMAAGGIQVEVPEDQLEEARELIASSGNPSGNSDEA